MKVNRNELQQALSAAHVGTTQKELVEQSNAFVFADGELISFNGEILVRQESPISIEGAVVADDFLRLIAKFPDDEVDVLDKGNEIQIKGKNRRAGLSKQSEVLLPYGNVPKPKKFRKLPDILFGTLVQAARVCGNDETRPRTTEVHVTPSAVEACDNYRIYRTDMKTGFKEEKLIPASSIEALSKLNIVSVSLSENWCHFKTNSGQVVSVLCSLGEYPDLSPMLNLDEAKRITLPENLSDIMSRAQVMQEAEGLVEISISDGRLTMRTSKDGGWFRESKKVRYDDEDIRFQVNAHFLQDVLEKTREVWIGSGRMKLATDEMSFVVALEMSEE